MENYGFGNNSFQPNDTKFRCPISGDNPVTSFMGFRSNYDNNKSRHCPKSQEYSQISNPTMYHSLLRAEVVDQHIPMPKFSIAILFSAGISKDRPSSYSTIGN